MSVLASDTVRPNAATRPRSPPSSFSAARVIARRPRHRQRKACPKAASRGLTLRQLLPPPRPPFLPQVCRSVHDAFVHLETRGGQVYNRREEDVEQEGCEHAPLTKASFHSKPPRAHPVVEPHACSHPIVELTNGRDCILWHAKTGEYRPEEGSINGVVYFGKVDKAYIQRKSYTVHNGM